VCLNELTYEGKQYYKGDVLYKTGSSWGVTSNPIQVTAGEYYNVSLKSRGKLYDIPLNFENQGQKYLMLDHWRPHNLMNSGYSILPLRFDENHRMTVLWTDYFEG